MYGTTHSYLYHATLLKLVHWSTPSKHDCPNSGSHVMMIYLPFRFRHISEHTFNKIIFLLSNQSKSEPPAKILNNWVVTWAHVVDFIYFSNSDDFSNTQRQGECPSGNGGGVFFPDNLLNFTCYLCPLYIVTDNSFVIEPSTQVHNILLRICIHCEQVLVITTKLIFCA